jgi:polysaccharide pyruvyl transferase WcaK-like protein
VSSSFTILNKVLTGDTALLFKPKKNLRKQNDKPIIGVNPGIYGHSLNSESVARYIDSHVKAIDFGIEKYGFQVVLLPHFVSGFKQDDMELCKQIYDKTKRKNNIEIYHAKTVDDFKSFLDSLDMLISSKMHPAIFASSGFVPTISIAYDHKQTGFFRRLNLANCVIEIRKITSKELIEKINYVWTNKEHIRDILKSEIPLLQENIKMNIRRSLLQ